MKRILLKLSGEALAGDKKTGFDEATVREVALQVKQLVDDGIEVGIVIGGGNFWRGRSSENIDGTKADQIGMLATIMNWMISRFRPLPKAVKPWVRPLSNCAAAARSIPAVVFPRISWVPVSTPTSTH